LTKLKPAACLAKLEERAAEARSAARVELSQSEGRR